MSKDTMTYLNDETFEQFIAEGVSFIDFYADWCGPCRMIAPIIEQLSQHLHGKAKVAKVDIETAQNVASSYQIVSIPTIIIFKDGKEVDRIVGVRTFDDFLGRVQAAI
ncbi:Thioredoxin [Candidatus Rubidus massiliensis]|nr:MAG: thioredoxin [Chlamydia sp. 32-24]CDZ80431.1 Thioredoxin [Candidatus Rubidus massiliensis]